MLRMEAFLKPCRRNSFWAAVRMLCRSSAFGTCINEPLSRRYYSRYIGYTRIIRGVRGLVNNEQTFILWMFCERGLEKKKKAALLSSFYGYNPFGLVPFPFSGSLGLFLSFYAGLFIMFVLADLCHDAGFLASTFKTAQSAV